MSGSEQPNAPMEVASASARANLGFTMVELVVTMVIISILSIISVPSYRGYVLRARAQEGVALVGSVAKLERAYYAEFGRYYFVPPFDPRDEQHTLPGGGKIAGYCYILDVRTTDGTYFKGFTVEPVVATGGFLITTWGEGLAQGIIITYIVNPGKPPQIDVTGIEG